MSEVNPQTIHRVMHEIKRRCLEVLRVVDLTPRMRRITLGGPELAGFLSLGSDDHIKLIFPQTQEEQAALATLVLGGGKSAGLTPPMRDYTPRRYDPTLGELDIDFVLHGDGPASTWAAQAAPGQYLNIGGPRSSMIVPDIFASYLLIGDETALPAIARRLQELPGNRRALVVLEIESDEEKQPLQSAAALEVVWVQRNAESRALLQAVRQVQVPPGELYAWVATEAGISRKLRRILLDEHGLSETQVKATGYWRAAGSAEE